jgi:hypothetical protein
MKSVGTVHSLNRVNRLVHLERLGQRRCTRSSNRVVAQAEGAFSDSVIVMHGVQHVWDRCKVRLAFTSCKVCIIVALISLRSFVCVAKRSSVRLDSLAIWSHGLEPRARMSTRSVNERTALAHACTHKFAQGVWSFHLLQRMPRQLLQDVFRQTLHLSCSRHRVVHDVDQQRLWPDVSPADGPLLTQSHMRGVSCGCGWCPLVAR